MAFPPSPLLWLITPAGLSTHTTSQFTGRQTDGRRVDSIRDGQPGESRRKVTEQEGRAAGVLLLPAGFIQVCVTELSVTFSLRENCENYICFRITSSYHHQKKASFFIGHLYPHPW